MPKKSNSPPKELIESTYKFLRKEGCGVEHLVNIQKPNSKTAIDNKCTVEDPTTRLSRTLSKLATLPLPSVL